MDKSVERETITDYLNFPDSSLYMIGIKYKYVEKPAPNEQPENERKEVMISDLKMSTSNHDLNSRASYHSGEDNLAVAK